MDTNIQAIPGLEEAFAVRPASDDNDDIFTNVNPLWCPLGLNAVFGGVLMSQALNAVMQRASPSFVVHSMHCHFIKATRVGTPVSYHVSRVSQGKASSVYTISARQNDHDVFISTLSFRRASAPVGNVLKHAVPKPKLVFDDETQPHRYGEGTAKSLFEFKMATATIEKGDSNPETKYFRRIVRAQSSLARPSGSNEHLLALVCMTDTYTAGTVGRAHGIPVYTRFNAGLKDGNPRAQVAFKALSTVAHTLHFHNVDHVCVNHWMTEELHCPWAGHERGLVISRVWSSDGILLATCSQEVLVRLPQDNIPARL
ncbi:acyl-CoA thioesterase II [Aspergillus eucalypticola CBS 122712]|uniref:Acyl-CoA thioesterase II n=1 Tax=Aspergillus eucalypticola (strain CBS 122712 / IBT 29274) TaxID=1448314 RepID=A0A317V744_ASPEC|nr:acyl-CoA thioesterase II [Aspergillus eucalypticola CBS 122712]PWY68888.1 acyl-CoA thioesterase II [Aspergillus eucalypticola CBS 122712]